MDEGAGRPQSGSAAEGLTRGFLFADLRGYTDFVERRGDDAAAQLTMPVIVGRAVNARETPVFIGEMRYIEFSPYWNVPPAIQRLIHSDRPAR